MRNLMFKLFLVVLAITGAFLWVRSDASVGMHANSLGLDDSGSWLAANSQNSRAFDVLEAANVKLLRVRMPWNEVELSPGAYAWAYQTDTGYVDYEQLFKRLEKRGIRPVVVLGGGPVYLSHLYPQQPVSREALLENWNNFVRAAVERFGKDVDQWQVGDGLNDPQAWGKVLFPLAEDAQAAPDPQLYADMLTSAYRIIKSADARDSLILGDLALGGDCGQHALFFLQSLNDAGAWFAMDAVSLRLPTLQSAPEEAVLDSCGFSPASPSGSALSDPILAVSDFLAESGQKSLWLTNLAISPQASAARAAERATLAEVVEADYLARASAILLAHSGADKLFWSYQPQNTQPGLIGLQAFANLAQTLSAQNRAVNNPALDAGEFKVLRFRANGSLSILAWRAQGGDEAQALVIPNVGGYDLTAYSVDAESLKARNGIDLKIDAGGSTALMVSERPVLIHGRPNGLKESASQLVSDQTAQARLGLQSKWSSWVQAQKMRAADQVGSWVTKQQTSLLDILRNSFQQWLRKSLGLAVM